MSVGFPVTQAALSGYSDWPMRRDRPPAGRGLYALRGAARPVRPQRHQGPKAKRFLRVTDDEHPCGAQLMGAVPEQFPPAALKLVAAGFDVIDLNFGCPVKKVLGRCRGGFLLSDPETALAIVARVRDALPPDVPLTVKMRRGMDDSPQSRDNFFAIFDGAFACGVAAITVHGRTVRQRYEGTSSREFLPRGEAARRRADRLGQRRPVHGRRIASTCSARRASTAWPLPAARSATRGSSSRSGRWPPAGRCCRRRALHQQREVIAEHYRLAEELYGPRRACRLMRKFGIKYAQLHPRLAQVRDAFVAVTKPADWQAVLVRWYAEDLPGVVPGPGG